MPELPKSLEDGFCETIKSWKDKCEKDGAPLTDDDLEYYRYIFMAGVALGAYKDVREDYSKQYCEWYERRQARIAALKAAA